MRTKLFPFQEAGVDFLVNHPHALLGDDPGLGKTVQAIAAAERIKARNVIVVCPASVRAQWMEAVDYETGWKHWLVLSYNQAAKHAHVMDDGEWDLLICDEAHYLKNPESQRTKAIFADGYGIARKCRYKWMLTGTPVLNRPVELYPVLCTLGGHLIKPYNTFNKFAQRYCGAYWEGPGRGMNVRGASRVDELAGKLQQFMLRREMDEVLPDLPPQIVSRVPLELTREELEALREVEAEIDNRELYISTVMEDYSAMGDSAKLLKATGMAKARAVCSFIHDQLNTVEKLVVFAWHRDVVDAIRANLAARGVRSVVHRGGMSDTEKHEAKRAFVSDPAVRVFVGNIRSSGTGLDGLQKATNTCVFVEMSWTPGEMEQCVRRLRRIGATKSCVNAYILHAPGTIESAVLGSHDGKTPIIKRLVGDGREDARKEFGLFAGL